MSSGGTLEETIKRLRVELDNYDKTVLALKALAHELQWDDNTQRLAADCPVHFGRRMDTSASNPVSPNATVEPDLTLQLRGGYAVLAEAKMSLPKDPDSLKKKLSKLRKYDDVLVGWYREEPGVKNHDIIVITDAVIGNPVSEAMKKMVASGALNFNRELALIKFAILERVNHPVSLELAYGKLSHARKSGKLADTVAIPMTYVIMNPMFAEVSLYDAEPPYPRLLRLIYEHLQGTLTRDQQLQVKEGKATELTVVLADLRQSLSEAYGPGQSGKRVPEIPKKVWVKRAMDLFVKLKWASVDGSRLDTYSYTVKKRRNTDDQFLKICAKGICAQEWDKGKQVRPGKQLEFPGQDS